MTNDQIIQAMRKHKLTEGATTEQVRQAIVTERLPSETAVTSFQVGGALSRMVREGKMKRGTPDNPKAWLLPPEQPE